MAQMVLVIDDELNFSAEIKKAVQEIDIRLAVQLFKTFAELQEWIKATLKEQSGQPNSTSSASANAPPNTQSPQGQSAVAEHGLDTSVTLTTSTGAAPQVQIVLLVVKLEMMGNKFEVVLKQTREFLIRHRLASAEQPPPILVTAYETDEKKLKACRVPLLTNVLLKPFDYSLLLQTIQSSLDPKKTTSSAYFYNQKTSTSLEMLKEITFDSLSDFGFTTKSDSKMEPGQMAKYYSTFFVTSDKQGLYAKCLGSQTNPESPQSFISHFEFFAPTRDQINNLRIWSKKYRTNSKTPPLRNLQPTSSYVVAVVDGDPRILEETADLLERNFSNCKVCQYSSWGALIKEINPTMEDKKGSQTVVVGMPSPEPYDFVIKEKSHAVVDIQPNPSPGVLGFSTKEMETTDFFEKRILPADLNKWKGLFKLSYKDTSPPTPMRVVNKDGETTVFEFIRVATEKPPSITGTMSFKIRELTREENLQFLSQNRQFQAPLDAILFDTHFLGDKPDERIKNVFKILGANNCSSPQFTFFLLSERLAHWDSKLLRFTEVHDVFYKPIDRGYLLAKLALRFPGLKNDEIQVNLSYLHQPFEGKGAREAQVEQVSESGLVLRNPYPMKPGEFRLFHLPRQKETDMFDLVGRVAYSDETGDQPVIHFSFFAMTDHFLKHIRNWIREYFISQKTKSQ